MSDPMACNMPGYSVLYHLLEFAQTHIYRVSDATQPSHPLPPPSLPALNLSQYQGLSQWVSSSNQVAKVLEFQLQHQSFQWIFRVDFLLDGLVWSCCPKDSQESSPAPELGSTNSLVLNLVYGPTFTFIHDYWKNHSSDSMNLCWHWHWEVDDSLLWGTACALCLAAFLASTH